MEKIQKCSCGGKGFLYSNDRLPPWQVVCRRCGKESPWLVYKNEVIREWNRMNKVRSEMSA